MERKFEVTENALWKRRGKAIVSKNLNRWRRCPRLASVLREMNRCVVEYQSDDDLIFYDVGLYKLIRAYLLSEYFVMTGAPYTKDQFMRQEEYL